MSKHSTQPFLPEKKKPLPFEKKRISRQDWEKFVNLHIRNYTKEEHKLNNPGLLDSFDLVGELLTRRKKVILDTLPAVISRYSDDKWDDPNMVGNRWVNLNTAFFSYSLVESQSHILLAASIWLLDHIDVEQAYPLLPKDEALLDDFYSVAIWDPQYAEELLASVQYLLAYRNGEPERTKTGLKRVLTDSPTAVGAQKQDTDSRKRFEQLLALLPQEAIDHAAAEFETLLWQWVDRFYHGLFPMQEGLENLLRQYEDVRVQYNDMCDRIAEQVKDLERDRRSGNGRQSRNAVMIPKAPALPQLPTLGLPVNPGSSFLQMGLEREQVMGQLYAKFEKLESLDKTLEDLLDKITDTHDDISRYILRAMRGFDAENPDLAPLPITDAYELCFALLYLIDSGSDLPWIYGAGVGLMQEVCECLPWGIVEYSEEDDAFWDDAVYEGKESPIPDWNERRYRRKDDSFARSLNQLLYEETGCIMPRDLHIYDRRAKALGKYGVRGKDAVCMLSVMSALAFARRQRPAVNLDSDAMGAFEETAEESPKKEDAAEAKAENKRLRASLHDAEKAARDARKALEDLKRQALMEHRELADLREYVFQNEKESEEQKEAPPQEESEALYPYAVRKNLLAFGGHASWTPAIKKLLKGNIRFIDKDYVFDTSIIRQADAIWIQPNALSHKQYYRIIDTARQYKIPVRYFIYASAQKCAEQVIGFDRD